MVASAGRVPTSKSAALGTLFGELQLSHSLAPGIKTRCFHSYALFKVVIMFPSLILSKRMGSIIGLLSLLASIEKGAISTGERTRNVRTPLNYKTQKVEATNKALLLQQIQQHASCVVVGQISQHDLNRLKDIERL
jgi:acid phosphatase family membrane protein YuiD